MQWIGRRQSSNVEDRRGLSGGLVAGGGIVGLLALLIALFFGGDTDRFVLDDRDQVGPQRAVRPDEEQLKQFTAVVLADTEDVWNELFRGRFGRDYQEPRLVLFSGTDRSGCGFASAATGPFYCPADEKVYSDLDFFRELQTRFRAGGDFAGAYVVAHEIGHHVQNQLGILGEVNARRSRVSKAESNQLSVRVELQADFLAGVWAYHAQRMKNVLEPGDLEEGLRAANSVGDDRLQKRAQGYVVPDSFTHGTSEQRVRWFRLGFETGDLARVMDTFELGYGEL